MMRFNLFFSLFVLFCPSCKSNKGTTEDTDQSCNIDAVVQDYSGLDGCGKIIITSDGYKILPSNPKVLDTYHVNETVQISYERKEDAASTCMAEDFIAHISCIKSNQKPMAKECIDANHKKGLTWLNGLPAYQISKIDKYSFLEDGWSYIVIDNDGVNRAYNCQGDLLCTYTNAPDSRCRAMLLEMTFLKTIYSTTTTK